MIYPSSIYSCGGSSLHCTRLTNIYLPGKNKSARLILEAWKMNTASYGPAPDCTGRPARQGEPAWYIITSKEVEQIRTSLLDLGNYETAEGRIRIWELLLILDTVQDRLA